jgi:hypothetical protein
MNQPQIMPSTVRPAIRAARHQLIVRRIRSEGGVSPNGRNWSQFRLRHLCDLDFIVAHRKKRSVVHGITGALDSARGVCRDFGAEFEQPKSSFNA